MDAGQQNQLRELLSKANEFQTKKSTELAQLPRQIRSGDLFIFPIDLPLTFVAVLSNSKDKELWFFVPGDEFPTIGTRDVAVPAFSSEGPLNFRCGNGVWIHTDDVNFDNRIGLLDSVYVEHIHDHLARDVKDNLPTAGSLLAADLDPDYEEWVEELSSAVRLFKQELLDQAFKSEATTTSMDGDITVAYSFSKNWMRAAGIDSSMALSADASGIDKLPELDEGEHTPVGCPIKMFDGPGTLVAIQYADEVLFQIYNLEEGQVPPKVVANGEKLEWHEAGYYWASDEIKWSDDMIEFSINDEQYLPIER